MDRLAAHPLSLDSVAHGGLGLAAGLSSAFFAVIAVRLGASSWLLALITSAPYVTSLLAPAWTAEARRWGSRRLVVGSLSVAAFTLLLLGVQHAPLPFSLLVVLYYLFYGISDPLYVAMAQIVYPERTGASLGRVGAVFNAARTVASAVAGWLMDSLGIRTVSALAALTTGVAAVSYVPFPDVSEARPATKDSPWHAVTKDATLRNMLLVFMVAGTGMLVMLPALPIIEVKRTGLSNTQIGALLAANSLALTLFFWVWGRIGDKPAYVTPIIEIGMALTLGMALLYVVAGSFAILLAANVLCGMGGAAIAVGWRLFAMHFGAYDTVDLAGLHLFTCGLRGAYAPALGALLISLWSVDAALIAAATLITAGMLILRLSAWQAPVGD